jgi:hypothetical protein
MVEVVEIPRETGQGRLHELAALVAPLSRGVVFELPSLDPGLIANLPSAVQLVTIQAPALVAEGGAGAVSKLLRQLATRRVRLAVKEIGSAGEAISLARAGVTLLAVG